MLSIRASLHNSANEFVAENGRSNVTAIRVRFVKGHHHRALGVFGDVGATEPIERDGDFHIVGAHIGNVKALDSHIARLVKHGGPHLVRHD
jgi:hypothetical protein